MEYTLVLANYFSGYLLFHLYRVAEEHSYIFQYYNCLPTCNISQVRLLCILPPVQILLWTNRLVYPFINKTNIKIYKKKKNEIVNVALLVVHISFAKHTSIIMKVMTIHCHQSWQQHAINSFGCGLHMIAVHKNALLRSMSM